MPATLARLLLLWPVHLADIKGRAVIRHSWVDEIRSMANPTFSATLRFVVGVPHVHDWRYHWLMHDVLESETQRHGDLVQLRFEEHDASKISLDQLRKILQWASRKEVLIEPRPAPGVPSEASNCLAYSCMCSLRVCLLVAVARAL